MQIIRIIYKNLSYLLLIWIQLLYLKEKKEQEDGYSPAKIPDHKPPAETTRCKYCFILGAPSYLEYVLSKHDNTFNYYLEVCYFHLIGK